VFLRSADCNSQLQPQQSLYSCRADQRLLTGTSLLAHVF
jgi:hypothetical protein